MSTPTKKQIKTQSPQLSRSGILNTYSKLGPASNQPKKSLRARAESKYVLWLHTCVSRDFWKFHSFLEKNPKIGNKSSLAGNFTFMARKVITKKGWLYSNVRYFRDLSCFCLSCPLFLRLTRRWLVVCLPPLLRQLLIPPPTGGHISKPSRLAYNISRQHS